MFFRYKSDNTKYRDPRNFIEYLILRWNNLWDKEYQESKRRYERLHAYDGIKLSKSEKAKSMQALIKEAKKRK